MNTISCDICNHEPDKDFILAGTIFESVVPFDMENIAGQKRLTKREIHICKVCFDKFISKHLNNKK